MAVASELEYLSELNVRTGQPSCSESELSKEGNEFVIEPYSKIAIQSFSASTHQESQSPPPSHDYKEICPYAQIKIPSTIAISRSDHIVNTSDKTSSPTASDRVTDRESLQPGNSSLGLEALHSVPLSKLDEVINPYAEITIKPIAQIGCSPVLTLPPIPLKPQEHGDYEDSIINPYAQIKILPLKQTTPKSPSGDPLQINSMDLAYGKDSGTQLTVDPQDMKDVESNYSRRRYSEGASLFLRATSDRESPLDVVPGDRRRLSLHTYKMQSVDGGQNKRSEPGFTEILADLRSSGVSFTTHNPPPRKKETETERQPRRSNSFSRRRRMTVGAHFLHRAHGKQDSIDSSNRGRKMSIGARFMGKAFGSRAPRPAAEPGTTGRRRMSIGARVWHRTRKGLKTSRLFKRDFPSIPKAEPSHGSEEREGRSLEKQNKGGWKGSTWSLGAQLLQRLTFKKERSSSPTPPPQTQDVEANTECYYHEETASVCSGEPGDLETIFLEVLKSSGISFPTNKILEAREIFRAIPKPPPLLNMNVLK